MSYSGIRLLLPKEKETSPFTQKHHCLAQSCAQEAASVWMRASSALYSLKLSLWTKKAVLPTKQILFELLLMKNICHFKAQYDISIFSHGHKVPSDLHPAKQLLEFEKLSQLQNVLNLSSTHMQANEKDSLLWRRNEVTQIKPTAQYNWGSVNLKELRERGGKTCLEAVQNLKRTRTYGHYA